MPTEHGESATDDPPAPTASNFPQTPEEALLAETSPEEEMPTGRPDNVEDTPPECAEETNQPHAAHQSHVIKNVDEIFLTIEGLMSKLRQLKVSLCSVSDMEVNPPWAAFTVTAATASTNNDYSLMQSIAQSPFYTECIVFPQVVKYL